MTDRSSTDEDPDRDGDSDGNIAGETSRCCGNSGPRTTGPHTGVSSSQDDVDMEGVLLSSSIASLQAIAARVNRVNRDLSSCAVCFSASNRPSSSAETTCNGNLAGDVHSSSAFSNSI